MAQAEEQPIAANQLAEVGHDERKRFCAWVFVTTDYSRAILKDDIAFIQYQCERHPHIGKHIQGYCEAKTRVSKKAMAALLGFPALQKGIPLGVNEEGHKIMFGLVPRRGSQEANIRYTSSSWYCRSCGAGDAIGNPAYAKACLDGCEKGETKYRISETTVVGKPWSAVRGNHELQGSIIEAVQQGQKRKMVLEQFGSYIASHMPWFNSVVSNYAVHRNWKPIVWWLYGPTGTDKSRIASAICTDAYFKSPDNKWFDGYDGERVVVMNDLRKSTFSFSYLLDLLDRYPLLVEAKGSMVPMTSIMFIVTSSKSPHELWHEIAGYENENVGQLTRRCEHIVRFPISLDDKKAIVAKARNEIYDFNKQRTDDVFGSWDGNARPEGVIPTVFRNTTSSSNERSG